MSRKPIHISPEDFIRRSSRDTYVANIYDEVYKELDEIKARGGPYDEDGVSVVTRHIRVGGFKTEKEARQFAVAHGFRFFDIWFIPGPGL